MNNKENLIAVTKADIRINFNNKGLKMLFPGTLVTKKKLKLGELDPKFLASAIKTSELNLKYADLSFTLEDIELEGEFNSWDVTIKLRVF